jgi:hypothetical protein
MAIRSVSDRKLSGWLASIRLRRIVRDAHPNANSGTRTFRLRQLVAGGGLDLERRCLLVSNGNGRNATL